MLFALAELLVLCRYMICEFDSCYLMRIPGLSVNVWWVCEADWTARYIAVVTSFMSTAPLASVHHIRCFVALKQARTYKYKFITVLFKVWQGSSQGGPAGSSCGRARPWRARVWRWPLNIVLFIARNRLLSQRTNTRLLQTSVLAPSFIRFFSVAFYC